MPKTTDKNKKEKNFWQTITINRKFLILAVFLALSVMAVAFSTKYLFSPNVEDWYVTQGSFENNAGLFTAKSTGENWAYHKSPVAYGTWEWRIRYYQSTDSLASVTFIGNDLSEAYSFRCLTGYQLVFKKDTPLTLRRLDDWSVGENIASKEVSIRHGLYYTFKVIRAQNNTFSVYLNTVLQFKVTDDTYQNSTAFELAWRNRQGLSWVKATDSTGSGSWAEYFTGLPTANSDNVFTMIALFTPFVALCLVVFFYITRLAISNTRWTSYIIPLLLAIGIGLGVGYLLNYLRTIIPEYLPPETEPTTTPTTTPTNGTTTTPVNDTTPSPTPVNGTGGGVDDNVFTGLPKNVVSIVLLVVSGIFIVVAVGFVVIDFIRGREEEFHEKTIPRDVRWVPKAEERDYRKRVIKAYHEASYDLIDHGAKSKRSMTPGEFEEEALTDFELPKDSLPALTDLYELARFSKHSINVKKSEKAESLSKTLSEHIRRDKNSKQKSLKEIDEKSADTEKEKSNSEKAQSKEDKNENQSDSTTANGDESYDE